MKGKIFVVVFFIMWMTFLELTSADDIECEFQEKEWYNGPPRLQYGCEIKSINQNVGSQNTIKGSHEARKNDNDVKIFRFDSGRRINLTRFDSIFCEKFPNLEEIYFNELVPASIDQNALQNCNKLVKFTLDFAEIRELPQNFLPTTLKRLYLRENKLTTLSEDFLKDVHQLEELFLGSNQINFLPPNIFKSLTKLRELSLFHNNLESLNPVWFESLQNLEELYLGDNKISELPRGVFAPLINLKELYLGENQLTVIHADSFGVHKKLKWINLSKNKLNAIDEKFLDILIASPAFDTGWHGGIDARENECVNYATRNRAELKQKFANCIANYQPRPQPPTGRVYFQSQTQPPYRLIPMTSEAPRRYYQAVSPTATEQVQIQQQQNCGISKTVQGNIVGGTYIKPNSFPWHAALFKEGNYRCGGTLVTERKIVTAAHCIQEKGDSTKLLPREANVLLGTHNLSDHFEEGRRSAAVRYIHIHENWNPNDRRYDFDIAVVVLSRPVPFDDYILPICLIPPQNTILRNSITFGYAVGYGYSEDVLPHEDVPKMILTPMTSYSDCIKIFPLLESTGSQRTFCGGTADLGGVCAGDSGGGLVVKYRNRFYLRGIVSSSLKGGDQMCGEYAYSIFTDVLHYRKWIDEIEVN